MYSCYLGICLISAAYTRIGVRVSFFKRWRRSSNSESISYLPEQIPELGQESGLPEQVDRSPSPGEDFEDVGSGRQVASSLAAPADSPFILREDQVAAAQNNESSGEVVISSLSTVVATNAVSSSTPLLPSPPAELGGPTGKAGDDPWDGQAKQIAHPGGTKSQGTGNVREIGRSAHSEYGPAVASAYRAFELDDANDARTILLRIVRAGPLERPGRDLLDVLLVETAPLDVIDAVLRHNDGDLSLLERSHWLARRFDSTPSDTSAHREAALDLLGAATMAGEAGWRLVQEPERRKQVDHALSEPRAQIDLLEQEALAPSETGLPETVPGRTLAFGRLMAARGEYVAVRDAERLLHVLREPQLAYLLESDRKRWGAGFRNDRPPPRPLLNPSSRLTIVLAGGHPPLRRLARVELDEMGMADVREFPSAWEGNRQGRHARDTIEGSDLAVVIWRQIAHSTSEQITSAARSLSVPVVRAETPTISAIRRAVTTFQDARSR